MVLGVKNEADNQRDVLFRARPCSVIRAGKYKLHEYFEDGGLELYDLESDPGESKNLAGSNPGERDRLHRQLIQWRDATDAPVPTELNPNFDREAEEQETKKRLAKMAR